MQQFEGSANRRHRPVDSAVAPSCCCVHVVVAVAVRFEHTYTRAVTTTTTTFSYPKRLAMFSSSLDQWKRF